jgi:hypothetical protein
MATNRRELLKALLAMPALGLSSFTLPKDQEEYYILAFWSEHLDIYKRGELVGQEVDLDDYERPEKSGRYRVVRITWQSHFQPAGLRLIEFVYFLKRLEA